ncbi:MAG TPA: hypothetical protein VMM55_13370, partial [Thermohalobaculum sp.]|nr:hypothetical protein [Thermohalobaculum sp.]
MFQDDRMMSILSGVVLMVAIGTVVQKSDQLQEWFAGDAGQAMLVADEIEARAGALVLIDVLANDAGVGKEAETGLVVTTRPACGRVFVQQGVLQYLTDAGCVGEQVFAYGVRESALAPAEVRVSVVPAEPSENSGPAETSEAEAPEVAAAGAPEAPGGAGAAVPEAGLTLAAGPVDFAPAAPAPAPAPEQQRDASPLPSGGTSADSPRVSGAPEGLDAGASPGREPASAAPRVGAPSQPDEPGLLAGSSASDVADGTGADGAGA